MWVPRRMEVYNPEGRLAAVTHYTSIRVNTGLARACSASDPFISPPPGAVTRHVVWDGCSADSSWRRRPGDRRYGRHD